MVKRKKADRSFLEVFCVTKIIVRNVRNLFALKEVYDMVQCAIFIICVLTAQLGDGSG